MDDQQEQLKRVMKAYYRQPHEIVLAEALLYTSEDPEDLAGRKAAAAALGYSRGGLYLDCARSLLTQIEVDTAEISWRKEALDVFEPILQFEYKSGRILPRDLREELARIVSLAEGAKYLLKDAELLWHFYAVSLDRSRHFMVNSALLVDPRFCLSPGDLLKVERVRKFRNHLEHRDKAILSMTGPDWSSFTTEQHDVLTVGYQRNSLNEIRFIYAEKDGSFSEEFMPLNRRGFDEIASIIQKTHDHVVRHSLLKLESYFSENPERMPHPRTVGSLVTDWIEVAQ